MTLQTSDRGESRLRERNVGKTLEEFKAELKQKDKSLILINYLNCGD